MGVSIFLELCDFNHRHAKYQLLLTFLENKLQKESRAWIVMNIPNKTLKKFNINPELVVFSCKISNLKGVINE